MSSSCESLTTKQRAQIDLLKDLCTQAEDTSGNQPAFNECATQLYAAVKSAEKSWNKEPLPSTEEVALLAERTEIIQLRAFNLPGMCEVKEIAFSFFFSLSPQDRTSFFYVNKDWNAAFQEFAQMETHDKVTAHLGCLKHNLAVLDAHLDAPLDKRPPPPSDGSFAIPSKEPFKISVMRMFIKHRIGVFLTWKMWKQTSKRLSAMH